MEQTYSPEAVEFAVSAIENAAAKAGVTGDVVLEPGEMGHYGPGEKGQFQVGIKGPK